MKLNVAIFLFSLLCIGCGAVDTINDELFDLQLKKVEQLEKDPTSLNAAVKIHRDLAVASLMGAYAFEQIPIEIESHIRDSWDSDTVRFLRAQGVKLGEVAEDTLESARNTELYDELRESAPHNYFRQEPLPEVDAEDSFPKQTQSVLERERMRRMSRAERARYEELRGNAKAKTPAPQSTPRERGSTKAKEDQVRPGWSRASAQDELQERLEKIRDSLNEWDRGFLAKMRRGGNIADGLDSAIEQSITRIKQYDGSTPEGWNAILILCIEEVRNG